MKFIAEYRARLQNIAAKVHNLPESDTKSDLGDIFELVKGMMEHCQGVVSPTQYWRRIGKHMEVMENLLRKAELKG